MGSASLARVTIMLGNSSRSINRDQAYLIKPLYNDQTALKPFPTLQDANESGCCSA